MYDNTRKFGCGLTDLEDRASVRKERDRQAAGACYVLYYVGFQLLPLLYPSAAPAVLSCPAGTRRSFPLTYLHTTMS